MTKAFVSKKIAEEKTDSELCLICIYHNNCITEKEIAVLICTKYVPAQNKTEAENVN